jgi:hypothetical protein
MQSQKSIEYKVKIDNVIKINVINLDSYFGILGYDFVSNLSSEKK